MVTSCYLDLFFCGVLAGENRFSPQNFRPNSPKNSNLYKILSIEKICGKRVCGSRGRSQIAKAEREKLPRQILPVSAIIVKREAIQGFAPDQVSITKSYFSCLMKGYPKRCELIDFNEFLAITGHKRRHGTQGLGA
jgi:hypothetical protein